MITLYVMLINHFTGEDDGIKYSYALMSANNLTINKIYLVQHIPLAISPVIYKNKKVLLRIKLH